LTQAGILFTGSVFCPVYVNKLALKHWLTRIQNIGGVVIKFVCNPVDIHRNIMHKRMQLIKQVHLKH